jgi:hypothetical protein
MLSTKGYFEQLSFQADELDVKHSNYWKTSILRIPERHRAEKNSTSFTSCPLCYAKAVSIRIHLCQRER